MKIKIFIALILICYSFPASAAYHFKTPAISAQLYTKDGYAVENAKMELSVFVETYRFETSPGSMFPGWLKSNILLKRINRFTPESGKLEFEENNFLDLNILQRHGKPLVSLEFSHVRTSCDEFHVSTHAYMGSAEETDFSQTCLLEASSKDDLQVWPNSIACTLDLTWNELEFFSDHRNQQCDPKTLDISLLNAVHLGDRDAVEAAISHGADLSVWEHRENDYYKDHSPLGVAIMMRHEAIIDLLLSHQETGFDDIDGWRTTPLHKAASNGLLKVVKKLVKIGADVNFQSDRNQTCLHEAIDNLGRREGEHLEVIRYLATQSNIDLTLRDIYGQTPLEKARKFSESNVTREQSKTLLKQAVKILEAAEEE